MNSCIAVAVVSALVFDKAGKWGWLVGTIGATAAVVTSVVYFYNLWGSRDNSGTDQESVPENAALDVGTSDQNLQLANTILAEAYSTLLAQQKAAIGTLYSGVLRRYLTHVMSERSPYSLRESFGMMERESRAEEIVKIVSHLTADEKTPSFEFVIEHNGNFVIRPVVPRRTSRKEWSERIVGNDIRTPLGARMH